MDMLRKSDNSLISTIFAGECMCFFNYADRKGTTYCLLWLYITDKSALLAGCFENVVMVLDCPADGINRAINIVCELAQIIVLDPQRRKRNTGSYFRNPLLSNWLQRDQSKNDLMQRRITECTQILVRRQGSRTRIWVLIRRRQLLAVDPLCGAG